MTRRIDAAGTHAFTWTDRGRLQTASDPLTAATRSYVCDDAGQVDTISYSDGGVRDLEFDDLGRMTSDTLRDGLSTVTAGTVYGYDVDGNVASKDVMLPEKGVGPAQLQVVSVDGNSDGRSDDVSSVVFSHVLGWFWSRAGGLARAVFPPGGSASFADRSRSVYLGARRWINTSATAVLALMSLVHMWPAGLGVASLGVVASTHAYLAPDRLRKVSYSLILDVTFLGVAMVTIGIPTVAAVLSVLMAFVAALLLRRRHAVLVSTYVLAWAGVAAVVARHRTVPALPAIDPTPWIIGITVFAVISVVAMSRIVIEVIAELERIRSQLLGGIAHDLRNPLSGVIGAAGLLHSRGDELEECDRAAMLDLVLHQATEANRMVDDILIAARLDASDLEVHPRRLDVVALMADLIHAQVVHGIARNVGFDPPAEAVHAHADPMRVRQIVHNLLSNAFRYGGADVSVATFRADGVVVVQVTDDGDGVPQAEVESIFTAFGRSVEGSRHSASIGLGLSVSRRLARLMGGDLTYRRQVGQTVFELTLPAADTGTASTARVGEAIATEHADVWLGADGVVSVSYRPGTRVENHHHAATVVAAIVRCAGGAERPIRIITHGARPDHRARRYYVENMRSRISGAAVVAPVSRPVVRVANMIAARFSSGTPVRIFAGEAEADRWLETLPRQAVDSLDAPGEAPIGS